MNQERYYVMIEGKQSGPHSVTELAALQGIGKIDSETPHWFEGLSEWIPIGTFVEEEMAAERERQARKQAAYAARMPAAPTGTWSPTEYRFLIILAILLPIIGLAVGFLGIWSPAKREQAGKLMGISAVVMAVAWVFLGLF